MPPRICRGGRNEWANIDIVLSDPRWLQAYPHSAAAQGRKSADLIQQVRDRPGHDRRYAIDATKITRELGFQPAVDFPTGIRQTILWYLEHPEWWRAVMDGSYCHWLERQYEGDGHYRS